MCVEISPLPKRPDSLSRSGIIMAKTGLSRDAFNCVCVCFEIQLTKDEGVKKKNHPGLTIELLDCMAFIPLFFNVKPHSAFIRDGN